ncbi:MAG: GGDEF domain-containing protein [Chitinivibrionia bacterium]|nr:GGDEF domain-containing protein [Chitinivibrionia bacterium]
MADKNATNTTEKRKASGFVISLKLLLSSLIIMFILAVVVSAVYVLPFRGISQNTTEMYLLEASGQIAYQIKLIFEKSLYDTRLQSRNLALIYRDVNRSRVIEILLDWYRNRPEYKAVYIALGRNVIGKDADFERDPRFYRGAFATYISSAPEGKGIKIASMPDNYKDEDKFKIPYDTQKSFISKPREQQVSLESKNYYLLMNIASPIVIGGVSVGVVGIDYSMEYIVYLVSQYNVLNNPKGFCSIASGDGSIIASKDNTLTHQNILNSSIIKHLNGSQKKELEEIVLRQPEGRMTFPTEFRQGQKTITGLYKFSIGDSDSSFIVMASVPENDVFSAINESTENAVIASVVVFAIGIFFLFILIQAVVIAPLVEQMKMIEKLSITDPLTGLSNRRFFEECFLKEWKMALRSKKPISFLMLDADKFKSYNDTYGHPQGDKLLIALSGVLKRSVHRPSDLAGRLGGEEFGILLPNTDLAGAVHIAEGVRGEVERLRIKVPETNQITTCTVSIGAASMVPSNNNVYEMIMKMADGYLYKAKENGRNRVYSALNENAF